MTGKTFIGVNGVARKPKAIYVGVNGVARKVKAAYVGVNGVARKVWPISDLPAQYTQLEYFDIITNINNSIDTLLSIKSLPRVVMSFMIPSKYTTTYSDRGLFGGCFLSADSNYNPTGYFSYDFSCYPGNNFYFKFGNGTGQDYVETPAFDQFTYAADGVNRDEVYTVDYNRRVGSSCNFYLSCTTGYYSIESHKLVGSISASNIGTMGVANSEYWNAVNVKLFESYKHYDRSYILGGPFRFFNAQIYNTSNTLLRNYVPCYRKADNHLGVYDLVTKSFSSTNTLITSNAIALGPEL